MSNHKTPPLNPRNWEALTESDEADLPTFEKLRHHIAEKHPAGSRKSGKQEDPPETLR